MSRPVFVDSRRDLLASLIDYEGLYPPASLGLEDAVAEYRRARSGDHRWMLGAFVINASLLEDLAATLVGSMWRGEAPWDISVILDGDVGSSASSAAAFEAEMSPAATIVMVEGRLPREVADVRDATTAMAAALPMFAAAASVSPVAMPFLEIPAGLDGREAAKLVQAVAGLRDSRNRNAGAKLRCGGVVLEAFPAPALVAAFLAACRDQSLPYKATAGLHHPIRQFDPDVGATRHGFLNLLVAAAVAETGADIATLEAIVAEQDPAALRVGAAGVTWRGHHAGAPQIALMRASRLTSYGSCSFDESIADLSGLGLIAGTEA